MVGIKSDQHMIFCSTELQLIYLFCLKQHKIRLFYQQKKHSITLITTVVQSTFNFFSSFFFFFHFLSPQLHFFYWLHTLKIQLFLPMAFSFSGAVFIYSFPCFLLLYQVFPFLLWALWWYLLIDYLFAKIDRLLYCLAVTYYRCLFSSLFVIKIWGFFFLSRPPEV